MLTMSYMKTIQGGLEQALNAPEEEGFVPLGYVWRIGWTADVFLVLEKQILEKSATTSPTP